jgi:hypothetical protein
MSDNYNSNRANGNNNGPADTTAFSAILAAVIIIGTVLMAFFFFMAMDDTEKDPGKEFIQEHQVPMLKKSYEQAVR